MARSWWLALLLTTACGGAAVPEPRAVPHPEHAYVEVPYPPPSAMAETMPPRPRPDALWVDGSWLWRGRYWVWDRGGWVVAPRGARYSRWRATYRADGTLLFAEAAWRDAQGRKLPPPRVLVPASTPPNERTPEHIHSH